MDNRSLPPHDIPVPRIVSDFLSPVLVPALFFLLFLSQRALSFAETVPFHSLDGLSRVVLVLHLNLHLDLVMTESCSLQPVHELVDGLSITGWSFP